MAKKMYDKALELRDYSASAITSTTAETGLPLSVRWMDNVKVLFTVSDLDTTEADETYVLSVEIADTVANLPSAPVEVGSITVTETGKYELPLSGGYMEQLDADAAAIRVKATLGGTSPSLTYGARIVPA